MAADKNNKPPQHGKDSTQSSASGGSKKQPPIPSFLSENDTSPASTKATSQPSQKQSKTTTPPEDTKASTTQAHPMQGSTSISSSKQGTNYSSHPDEPPIPNFLDQQPASDPEDNGDAFNYVPYEHQNYRSGAQPDDQSPFTDAHFAWIQEYLAKSNQYFLSVSRFTVFGLTSTLLLLGIILFSAGFLTAFWLIAYTNVINGREGPALEATGQNSAAVQQQQPASPQSFSEEIQKIREEQRRQEQYDEENRRQQQLQNQDIDTIQKNIQRIQNEEQQLRDELNTPTGKVAALTKNYNKQKTYHTVVLFSSALPSDAIEKARDLETKGYSVYIVKHHADSNAPTNYRVQIGAYKSQKFAQNVEQFLQSQLKDKDIAVNPGILQDSKERVIYPQ